MKARYLQLALTTAILAYPGQYPLRGQPDNEGPNKLNDVTASFSESPLLNNHVDGDPKPRLQAKVTAYELICLGENTREFCDLINQYPSVRKKLNDFDSSLTVFVPADTAFENLPQLRSEHLLPEFLRKMIRYHVVDDIYSLDRVMSSHTIPTLLNESSLGYRPQRVRVSVDLSGIDLNFGSRITQSGIEVANGVLHMIEDLLMPPPRQGKLIKTLPAKLTTFASAMEKTGLADDLRQEPQAGGTIFAPSNRAWEKLRPDTSRFLFSRDGEKYLRALLEYHIVINATLYSDAYYKSKTASPHDIPGFTVEADQMSLPPIKRRHASPQSLLPNRTIEVDVVTWMEFSEMSINRGKSCVMVQDGIASDGVVHVVGSVLIPPKYGGRKGHDEDAKRNFDRDGVTVKELKERLDEFIKNDDGSELG